MRPALFFNYRDKVSARCAAFTLSALIFLTVGCASSDASENKQAHVCNMAAIKKERTLVAVPGLDGKLPSVTEVPLNSSAVLDKSISEKVYVRNASVRRTATGTVEVRSMIANCTDFPLQVEGRIQFYDADQAPSEPASAWKRVYLAPRSDGMFQEMSIGTDSVHFYIIEVREGR